MPRKLSFLCAAALVLTGPAAAATLTVGAGPSSSFANQTCDGPGVFSGSTTQTITRNCTRPDVGDATGKAIASVGHLGATAVATTHSAALGAGMGAQADFSDVVTFI